MLRPEQIINKQFAPAGRGVYNSQEVDDFIKAVAESYEQATKENGELIKKISILADKVEEYRRDEEAITASLLTAHRMAENVRREASESAQSQLTLAEGKSRTLIDEATRQAQDITEEAKSSAKVIVVNAREAVAALSERAQKEAAAAISAANATAKEIVDDAMAKGEKILGDSEQRFKFFQSELERLAKETEAYRQAVSALCTKQLDLIAGIPADYIPAAAPAQMVYEQPIINDAQEEPAPAVEETPEESALFNDILGDVDISSHSPAEEANAKLDDILAEAPAVPDVLPSIDDFSEFTVTAPAAEPEAELAADAADADDGDEEEVAADNNDDDDSLLFEDADEFKGFKVDLDEIDDDDEDIGSLFGDD